jgi:hypothetical protein
MFSEGAFTSVGNESVGVFAGADLSGEVDGLDFSEDFKFDVGNLFSFGEVGVGVAHEEVRVVVFSWVDSKFRFFKVFEDHRGGESLGQKLTNFGRRLGRSLDVLGPGGAWTTKKIRPIRPEVEHVNELLGRGKTTRSKVCRVGVSRDVAELVGCTKGGLEVSSHLSDVIQTVGVPHLET